MNQRISLYTRATTLNSYGEKSDAYTTAGSVWGSVKHSTGGESLVSFKNKPISVIHITARNFSGTTGDEIEYSGYRWEIEGVRRKHRQNNITIIANRLRKVVPAIEYYIQPDGSSFYLTPTGDKYLQP